MAMGPGIYDDLCTQLRESSHAVGVAVIVFQGEHGSGFSLELPALLRQMAKDIDRDMKNADAVEAEVQRAVDA